MRALWALLLAGSLRAADLPDGPGREIVLAACTTCHRADQIALYRRSKEEWQNIVARMIDRGAQVGKDQVEPLVAYLAKNLAKADEPGKVNVNKATAKEIEAGLNLTAKEAQAIVDYREEHGPFNLIGQLYLIYGVDGRKIEAAKERISF
jgi:competence protein ComEA